VPPVAQAVKPIAEQVSHGIDDLRFVAVFDRNEQLAAIGQGHPCPQLCLGKGGGKIRSIPMTSPVDFISGRKHRIDAGEAVEREDGFLDRDIVDVEVDRW
jgi:hypothetical protein